MTSENGKNLLIRNLGNGRFEDISAESGTAFAQSRCGRDLAFGDIFHSGQPDLVINNINDQPSLIRNQAPSPNSWLLVKLVDAKTNKAAIGSRVILNTGSSYQMQEVRSGGSFCSQNDFRLHFGLGPDVHSARLEVHWLGGAKETLERVPATILLQLRKAKESPDKRSGRFCLTRQSN
jgi:enediyne biosynthesis protein E4